jgi:hypothetical protein
MDKYTESKIPQKIKVFKIVACPQARTFLYLEVCMKCHLFKQYIETSEGDYVECCA